MRAPWEPCPGSKIPKILKHIHRYRISGESLYEDGWSVAVRWHERTDVSAIGSNYNLSHEILTVLGRRYVMTTNNNQIDCLQL